MNYIFIFLSDQKRKMKEERIQPLMKQSHPIMGSLVDGISFSGDLRVDVTNFIGHHGHNFTAEHCLTVAKEAKKLAGQYNEDEESAFQAGLLHDISAVFPAEERTLVAKKLGVDILPEEETFPLIIHQKLSAYMAQEIFAISNHAILNAIGCHTTLKVNATIIDKILFVADKIKWDQQGTPPYLKDILLALDSSLDAAAFCYLEYMWQRKSQLKVIHPWLREAYFDLGKELGKI